MSKGFSSHNGARRCSLSGARRSSWSAGRWLAGRVRLNRDIAGRSGGWVVALLLCCAGLAAGCSGGGEHHNEESSFEWLLDPHEERFPPADQALALPGFRVARVHYWQGKWNFNFWTNLKASRIDDDFGRIRDHGFNTILLTVPWGYFQPRAFPPDYDDRAFEKLALLLDSAARHHLYVILRVGTLDELPAGIQGGRYRASSLLLEERELEAYSDLFRETARRTAAWKHVLFLFFSWEELSGHLFEAVRDVGSRLDYMKRTSAFRDYLAGRELSYWNERWQTHYQTVDEMPFPTYGSVAYGDFLKFADRQLMEMVLPRVAAAARRGAPRVRLSYEIRVDSEPVWSRGRDSEPDWFDHRTTWNLIPDYPIITAYFNPYWGAFNEGDVITPETAAERLTYMLDEMEERILGKPIFFDQLNFVDATPSFVLNSRLEGERDIGRFLELSLSTLKQRSLGYAVWAFRAYEADSLYNSSFEDGLRGWQTFEPDRARVSDDRVRGEKYLRLDPGGVVQQVSNLHPEDEDPFHLRLMARSSRGGKLAVRFEVDEGWRWRELSVRELSPPTEWQAYRVQLSHAKEYRLTLESIGSTAVELDELSLANYVQTSSVLDQEGRRLGRRSEIFTSNNLSWWAGVGKVGLETPSEWTQDDLAQAGHTYPDNWVSRQVVIPVLIPWYEAVLELQLYLPEDGSWSQGNLVQVKLEDSYVGEFNDGSLGEHLLSPGMNHLEIPVGEPLYPRHWKLRLSFRRGQGPVERDTASADDRILSAVLLAARVLPAGSIARYWKGQVIPSAGAEHVQAAVQVADGKGAPLGAALVVGHTGGRVEAGKTDRSGKVTLRLELDPGRQSVPVFVEVLAANASISSVQAR